MTSILCLSSDTAAGTVAVPSLSRYWRPGQHFLVRHPQQMRGELVGDIGPRLGCGQHIAAGNIHFIGQRQGDRVAGNRLGQIAIHGDDARDLGGAARFGDRDRYRPA